MGKVLHHAIVVTSWDTKLIKKARKKARSLFGFRLSRSVHSRVNGYISFFIAPDGSMEGWEDSDKGDEQRKAFIGWLNKQAHSNGSNSLEFCEVCYSGSSLVRPEK